MTKKTEKQPGSMSWGELIDLAEETQDVLINNGKTEDVRFHLSPILDVVNQGKQTPAMKRKLEEAVIWLLEVHSNLMLGFFDETSEKDGK